MSLWKKLLGVFGLILVLFVVGGGQNWVMDNYLEPFVNRYRWLEHLFWIFFFLFYSNFATFIIIALYEDVYRANPLPFELHPDRFEVYISERDRKRKSALAKTRLVVSVIALSLYALRCLS